MSGGRKKLSAAVINIRHIYRYSNISTEKVSQFNIIEAGDGGVTLMYECKDDPLSRGYFYNVFQIICNGINDKKREQVDYSLLEIDPQMEFGDFEIPNSFTLKIPAAWWNCEFDDKAINKIERALQKTDDRLVPEAKALRSKQIEHEKKSEALYPESSGRRKKLQQVLADIQHRYRKVISDSKAVQFRIDDSKQGNGDITLMAPDSAALYFKPLFTEFSSLLNELSDRDFPKLEPRHYDEFDLVLNIPSQLSNRELDDETIRAIYSRLDNLDAKLTNDQDTISRQKIITSEMKPESSAAKCITKVILEENKSTRLEFKPGSKPTFQLQGGETKSGHDFFTFSSTTNFVMPIFENKKYQENINNTSLVNEINQQIERRIKEKQTNTWLGWISSFFTDAFTRDVKLAALIALMWQIKLDTNIKSVADVSDDTNVQKALSQGATYAFFQRACAAREGRGSSLPNMQDKKSPYPR